LFIHGTIKAFYENILAFQSGWPNCAIVFFGQFLKNTEVDQIYGPLISTAKVMYQF
jgi:hypothetical protein